ncbi:GNAT family N-acetyltransferase [Demequina sp. NBRC 110055]|uniref:GNAT family N-acetyltransferase n=1 Tax=Demequina sp. NBRC 110055 TaxID=1570344 RepID=UPI0009FDAD6A|nr:GNAT family N-acetyltransferase [Demequina sp. NBRC 110055]
MAGHEAGAGGDPAPAFVRSVRAARAVPTVRPARPDDPRDRRAVSDLLAAYLIATEREKGAEVAGTSALPESYRREVADPAAALAGATVLLAEDAGEPLGMVVLTAPDEGRCEVKRLWTVPAARGRGVAAALVEAACERAQARGDAEVALTVWRWRDGARRLYARLGFVEVDSWEERADLVCMTRALAPVISPIDGPERS